MIILGKQKRKKWPCMDEKIASKNRDNKYFIAIFYEQSIILRVKTILLT